MGKQNTGADWAHFRFKTTHFKWAQRCSTILLPLPSYACFPLSEIIMPQYLLLLQISCLFIGHVCTLSCLLSIPLIKQGHHPRLYSSPGNFQHVPPFSMDKVFAPVNDQTLHLLLDPSFSGTYYFFSASSIYPFYWIIPLTTLMLVSLTSKREEVEKGGRE